MASIISSPIVGKIGTYVGPRPLYLIGSFGQSMAIMAFGFLVYVDDPRVFISICFILR